MTENVDDYVFEVKPPSPERKRKNPDHSRKQQQQQAHYQHQHHPQQSRQHSYSYSQPASPHSTFGRSHEHKYDTRGRDETPIARTYELQSAYKFNNPREYGSERDVVYPRSSSTPTNTFHLPYISVGVNRDSTSRSSYSLGPNNPKSSTENPAGGYYSELSGHLGHSQPLSGSHSPRGLSHSSSHDLHKPLHSHTSHLSHSPRPLQSLINSPRSSYPPMPNLYHSYQGHDRFRNQGAQYDLEDFSGRDAGRERLDGSAPHGRRGRDSYERYGVHEGRRQGQDGRERHVAYRSYKDPNTHRVTRNEIFPLTEVNGGYDESDEPTNTTLPPLSSLIFPNKDGSNKEATVSTTTTTTSHWHSNPNPHSHS